MIEQYTNKIINADCLDILKQLPDKCIDMVLTSPPYDNLRTYNGTLEWSFDIFQDIAKELARVLRDGSVIVWNVSDATIDGSETGTSFRQALYFKELGLNLHDTMIWNKPSSGSVGSMNRYEQTFEYMFIFSKGRPKSVNLIMDKKNKRSGELLCGSMRKTNGETIKTSNYNKKIINEFGRRKNVWEMPSVMGKDRVGHPAPFPVNLAQDHIVSWSNENDIILDCFSGSGTTAVACVNTKRRFICIEKDKDYYEASVKRLEEHQKQLTLF